MLKVPALLLSIAVVSAIPANSQEAPQSGTPNFQAGTRMVLVPVVVRNHEGRTVSDLQRESFQLFDKGKEQPIASFSVERGESATAPAQFIAYFFDDLSLHDFGMLRPAALHQLANLRPDDRVAIFFSSCRLALDFTGDRAKLQEVMAKLGPTAAPVCQLSPLVPLRIALLKAVVSRMAHLPGTKRIVVVSVGLAVTHADQEAWESLIDQAAEAKVTIDSLHIVEVGGIQSAMSSAEGAGMYGGPNLRGRDNRGAYVDPGNLNLLADGTGGAVVEAGNAPEAGLRTLGTPDCVYMLGYSPQKANEGYHKLKVIVKDARKLSVRARAGYYSTVALSTSVTAEAPASEPPEERVSAVPVLPPVKSTVEAPEIDTRNLPVTFRARTNLVMVPVVVLNPSGLVVGGLHKSDFQLSDRGQRQEIVSFSEEKMERPAAPASPFAPALAANAGASAAKTASPAVMPDRFTAYVFDDVHMRFADLSQVREAVWKYIRDSAGPSDRIAVLTTTRKVYTDFTDNLDTLHAALFKITAWAMYRSVCRLCGDLSFFLANKVAMGDTIALRDARPIVMEHSIPCKQPCPDMKTEAAADRAVELGVQETSLSLDALRDIARRMSALAGRRTIVLASQGFLVPAVQQVELEHTINWALRSGVTIQTLNIAGLSTGWEMGQSPTDDDTVEPSDPEKLFPWVPLAREAGAQTLRTIAESTGGTAIENSNDYLGAVRHLSTPPEYRYILGFTPQDLAADGSFHKLTLKLANSAYKGFTLQARRGYYSPKQGEGLPEAAAKEIENAVFSRDDIRDLPVEMRTEVKNGGELTVSTDIDLKLLHYRKADGRNCQELTAVAAIFDRDGNFVAGKQQALTLKLRDETMDGLGQKPPQTLQSWFALSPGTYLVRLVVRSAVDQTMTEVSTQVEVR